MRKLRLLPSPSTPWLVTFADIIMLLMVFFVLLLSISSVNKKNLSHVSIPMNLLYDQTGEYKEEDMKIIKEASMLLVDEKNITTNKTHILELIFSEKRLPSHLYSAVIKRPVDLQQQRQGVAFIFANSLLFTSDTLLLSKSGEQLLDLLTPVIQTIDARITIKVGGNYSPALNAKKSMSLLAYLYSKGVQQNRLSIEVSGVSGSSQTELIIK